MSGCILSWFCNVALSIERHAFQLVRQIVRTFSAGVACRSAERDAFSAGFACRSIERHAFSAENACRFQVKTHAACPVGFACRSIERSAISAENACRSRHRFVVSLCVAVGCPDCCRAYPFQLLSLGRSLGSIVKCLFALLFISCGLCYHSHTV